MHVTVYSTPDCPFCSMVKSYLNNAGIKFREFDVSKDQERAKEMYMKSRQRAVPVVEANGRIIVGFRPEEIERALKSRKLEREDFVNNVIFDPFDQ